MDPITTILRSCLEGGTAWAPSAVSPVASRVVASQPVASSPHSQMSAAATAWNDAVATTGMSVPMATLDEGKPEPKDQPKALLPSVDATLVKQVLASTPSPAVVRQFYRQTRSELPSSFPTRRIAVARASSAFMCKSRKIAIATTSVAFAVGALTLLVVSGVIPADALALLGGFLLLFGLPSALVTVSAAAAGPAAVAAPAVAAPFGATASTNELPEPSHTTIVEPKSRIPVALRFAAAFDDITTDIETVLSRRADDNLPRPNVDTLRSDFYSRCARFQEKAQAAGAPATTSGPRTQLRSAESEAEKLFALLGELNAYKQDLLAAAPLPAATAKPDVWESLTEDRAELRRRTAIVRELNAPYVLE